MTATRLSQTAAPKRRLKLCAPLAAPGATGTPPMRGPRPNPRRPAKRELPTAQPGAAYYFTRGTRLASGRLTHPILKEVALLGRDIYGDTARV